MGLYDEVTCEAPLPGLDDPTRIRFQTKDLECVLDHYRITREGRLMHETYRVEDRSDPNAEGLLALRGMCTRIPLGWEDTDYHGMLSFYGNEHWGGFAL